MVDILTRSLMKFREKTKEELRIQLQNTYDGRRSHKGVSFELLNIENVLGVLQEQELD